jgi:hypothetical protein
MLKNQIMQDNSNIIRLCNATTRNHEWLELAKDVASNNGTEYSKGSPNLSWTYDFDFSKENIPNLLNSKLIVFHHFDDFSSFYQQVSVTFPRELSPNVVSDVNLQFVFYFLHNISVVYSPRIHCQAQTTARRHSPTEPFDLSHDKINDPHFCIRGKSINVKLRDEKF